MAAVTTARTRSPGSVWRTKTTRPSGARATQEPPAATAPTCELEDLRRGGRVGDGGRRRLDDRVARRTLDGLGHRLVSVGRRTSPGAAEPASSSLRRSEDRSW